MGSVGADYKCPLCRSRNGGYALDGCNVGPICTVANVRYNCLDLLTHDTTPLQIVAKVLQKVLGRDLELEIPFLANGVAPWVVNCGD